jgi:hypothetical protein
MSYLILHKVRGEAAYDIGEKLEGENLQEDIWIIPTSGHRAYPFMTWNIDDLIDASDIDMNGNHPHPASMDHHMPADWPDHYPMDVGAVPKSDFNVMSVLSGLMPKLKRRF